MKDVYHKDNLKYKLSSDDIGKIDDVWKLINIFDRGIITMREYRTTIINEIGHKYTVDKFFKLEKIIEKLFWNLRYKINSNIADIIKITETGIENMAMIKHKLKEDNYYRSFINKIINIDDINNKIYYKKMEGSSDIFEKNQFNLLTCTILFNRELYEQVMSDQIDIKNIKLPEYYFQMDYGFPNLNTMRPFIGSDNFRKHKIKKMLFDTDAESNWFKIIKP